MTVELDYQVRPQYEYFWDLMSVKKTGPQRRGLGGNQTGTKKPTKTILGNYHRKKFNQIFSANTPPRTNGICHPFNDQSFGFLWIAVIPKFTSAGPAAREMSTRFHPGLGIRKTYDRGPECSI